MNTPKEKAKEILNKFSNKFWAHFEVDEYRNLYRGTDKFKYWDKVKNELRKLK